MKDATPTILFCDKRYDVSLAPTKLSIQDVNERFGFSYITLPSLRESYESCINYVRALHPKAQIAMPNILDKPEENIIIHQTCKSMGWGLAAAVPIRAGTVVLEYLGNVGKISEIPIDTTYTLCLDDSGINADVDKVLFTSALHRGNLARFACYLPDEQPFNNYRVKLANLDGELIPGPDGRNHLFYVAKADIEAGEELGWDYGGGYSNSLPNPIFYDEDKKIFFRKKSEESDFNHKELTQKVLQDKHYSEDKKVGKGYSQNKAFNPEIANKIGIISLTGAELIEHAPLINYFLKEIIIPLTPFNTSFTLLNSINLPENNAFWVTAHFSLTSLGYYFLSTVPNSNEGFTLKLIMPIAASTGYAVRLNIADQYKEATVARLNNKIATNSEDDDGLFVDCFNEVAFNAATAFIFSIPTAISFTSAAGVAFSAFSTFNSATLSTLNCAASNSKIIAPDDSFSGKVVPYLADIAVSAFLINKASCFQPEASTAAVILKQAFFFLSAVVSTDQITKATVELLPNNLFEYVDSYFGIEQSIIGLNHQEESGFYHS